MPQNYVGLKISQSYLEVKIMKGKETVKGEAGEAS